MSKTTIYRCDECNKELPPGTSYYSVSEQKIPYGDPFSHMLITDGIVYKELSNKDICLDCYGQ